MQLVDGEVFTGKAVTVDGKHFHNCRFDKNCTLIYEGGEWAESNCTFEPGIKLTLAGSAMRTMQFMARFGAVRQVMMAARPVATAPKPSGAVQ